MKDIFNSKQMIVFLVILVILPIYCYLLFIDPFHLRDLPSDVIIYLILALLIVYLVYIVTSIAELFMLKITKVVNVNHVIVFPFTFDGKIRFVPFKLLASQLYLQGYTVINLANDIKNGANENELKEKLKRIHSIRIIATIVAYVVMLVLLNHIFDIYIVIALLTSCIAEIILSYTTDRKNWFGTGYLLVNGNIEHYLYTIPNLEEFSAKDYAQYIDRTIESVEEKNDDSYVEILENEIYASIDEEKQPWEIDRLKYYCKTILATTYSANWSTISHEARKNGLKKCLGLYALLTKDDKTMQFAIEMLDAHVLAVKGTTAAKHTEQFLHFLEGGQKEIKPRQHVHVGIVNYFSHRHQIEQKIIQLLNSSPS